MKLVYKLFDQLTAYCIGCPHLNRLYYDRCDANLLQISRIHSSPKSRLFIKHFQLYLDKQTFDNQEIIIFGETFHCVLIY